MDGIEVVRQDGPARLGILKHGELEVSTPEGFYLEETCRGIRRYKVGLESKLTLAVAPQPGIISAGNARTSAEALAVARSPVLYSPRFLAGARGFRGQGRFFGCRGAGITPTESS